MLQDQVSGMTQEPKNVKQKIKELRDRAEKNQLEISSLDKRINETNKKLIYLEDNSRRSNIKIMNFQLQHGQDLKKEIITWVNPILGTQHLNEQDIERANFVGNPQNPRTRPMVVKFFNYTVRRKNNL